MHPRKLNTRRIIKTFYRSWWRRPLWLVVTLLVVPLLVGRVMLNPLLDKAVRRHLASIAGQATANFGDLDVFLFPPSFTFRDVVVRGPSGESLDADRLEVHLTSVRELTGKLPHVRLRIVHPQLRVVPGAGDLERWARALPSARVVVAGVENGTISNTAVGDKRAVFQGVTGDIEGLTTGAASASGWQTRMDARMDGVDPIRALFKMEAQGSWEATFSVQQPSTSPPSGSGPLVIEAHARGISGSAVTPAVRASVTARWSGPQAPVAVAQDRMNRLAASWPIGNLSINDIRAGSGGSGQSLEIHIASGDGAVGAVGAGSPRFAPFDAIALAVNIVRLTDQALLPPPPGTATLAEVEATAAVDAVTDSP